MTRIGLIHALAESMQPIREAFASEWPEATLFDVLDTSLARDLAAAGHLEPRMIDRFVSLGRYAESVSGEGGATAGVLFTCSAFGRAIEIVKRTLSVPVLGPTEAAFEEALSTGSRIGLLVSFAPSLGALQADLLEAAQRRGLTITVTARLVEGALGALQKNDFANHDRVVAAAAAAMPAIDVLILGQFSLARAAAAISRVVGRKVITTPSSAVVRLRTLCAGATRPAE